ncbi:S-adenosyl-L-methionine-dependent methyltransferase [Abortiporus biennis]|nr:S-adenosyl-L-methionine-dependent methyltransferase [Abortiporus biennis]
MPRCDPKHLLNTLSIVLGNEAAKQELKWMQQAIHPKSVTLQDMVARRVRGEPLQYILGTQPFGPLTLFTRPPVLIPRPETEHWSLTLADRLRPSPQKPISLLDLCTGSACIPLLLCHLSSPGSIHACGVDISQDAISLARDNAAHCGVHLPEESSTPSTAESPLRNTFLPLLADIRSPDFLNSPSLRRRLPFDVITSNPPYIPRADYDRLSPSVKDYEDIRALLGDLDPEIPSNKGLTFYHDIAKLLPDLLADDGLVAVEVGEGQAADVRWIFEQEGGLVDTEIWTDPWEKERVVLGHKKPQGSSKA